MDGLVVVALGSALGGVARYALSGFVGRRIGETFPWGTMAVNVSGAVAIGVVAATLPERPGLWHFAVVGFFGSYTTVSSVSLQTLALVRDGERWKALGNVLVSLALCIGGVGAGFAFGAALVAPG